MKFAGGSNPDCTGAEIKLNHDTGNLYSVAFSGGGVCKAKGTLRYTGQALKGKIAFEKGLSFALKIKSKTSLGIVEVYFAYLFPLNVLELFG